MSVEIDNWAPLVSHAPASASVYQRVRQHMRNLRGLRQFRQEHEDHQDILLMTPEAIRKLEQQHFPFPGHPARLEAMSNEELERNANEARQWLIGILDCTDRLLDKEHQTRLFRLAVEKHLDGSNWSEKEQLYMALTDCELSSPQERLRSGFIVVLRLRLNDSLKDLSALAAVRTERLSRAIILDAELEEVRERLAEKARSITIDHFACAIPLAESADANDVNNGCCPVCQNSYTSLWPDDPNASEGPQDPSTSPEPAFRIEDLLADYPVRIKHCGHVIGKQCLETWMSTAKIDEAKFPHRTCPFCRVKIEGVDPPAVPKAILPQFKGNIRALETADDLVWGYDLEVSQCVNTILACMSEEIACEQLLSIISSKMEFKRETEFLKKRLEGLKKEKWAWGFKGNRSWEGIRDGWMNSGVRR